MSAFLLIGSSALSYLIIRVIVSGAFWVGDFITECSIQSTYLVNRKAADNHPIRKEKISEVDGTFRIHVEMGAFGAAGDETFVCLTLAPGGRLMFTAAGPGLETTDAVALIDKINRRYKRTTKYWTHIWPEWNRNATLFEANIRSGAEMKKALDELDRINREYWSIVSYLEMHVTPKSPGAVIRAKYGEVDAGAE